MRSCAHHRTSKLHMSSSKLRPTSYIRIYHLISCYIICYIICSIICSIIFSIICYINIICYIICYISYIMLYQMHMLYHFLCHIQRLDIHKHLTIFISGPFFSAVDPGLTELHTPLGLSGCGTGRDKENRWGKLEIGGKCLCKYTILETLFDLFWGYYRWWCKMRGTSQSDGNLSLWQAYQLVTARSCFEDRRCASKIQQGCWARY